MDIQPFSGAGNAGTGALAVTTSSQSFPLPGRIGNQVYLYNGSTGVVSFTATKGNGTAALTDTFVAPGTSHAFSIDVNADTINLISTVAGNVWAQRGFGL